MHIILLILISIHFVDSKNPIPYNLTRPSSKYDNPNFIRDRYHGEIWKPMMKESWVNRFRQPFNPMWMDYCDPYHCSHFHKPSCGLNRQNMRFKWFQSQCHLIMNNMCSTYRGSLRYDLTNMTYCLTYVMFRSGCPSVCPKAISPVCAVSGVDNHVVLFKNRCHMDKANCRGAIEEYEKVKMDICRYFMY